MKISANILIPAALLALVSCAEPRKNNVVDVRPGAPLFPSAAAPGQAGATGNVNPPHGQPGHNCAIPVGAPLTATPAPNLNTAPAVAPGAGSTVLPTGPLASPAPPAAVTPTPPPLPVATPAAAGTNPPHGQPGHDCSIAVGAPLTKKNAAATQVTSTPVAPAAAPAPATGPGLNPAHGQPGHDCSIAVGAPLKSK
jgi:hypothetical protein